eukprot:738992-Pelagomonas_calceolata.AAC.4
MCPSIAVDEASSTAGKHSAGFQRSRLPPLPPCAFEQAKLFCMELLQHVREVLPDGASDRLPGVKDLGFRLKYL